MKPVVYDPHPAALWKIRDWLTYVVDFTGPNEPHGYRDGVADGVAYREDTHRDISHRLAWISKALAPHAPRPGRAGPRYKGWDIRTYRALDHLKTIVDDLVGTNPDDLTGPFNPGRTPEGQSIMQYKRGYPPDPEHVEAIYRGMGTRDICFRESVAGVIPDDLHAGLARVLKEVDLALRPFKLAEGEADRAAMQPAADVAADERTEAGAGDAATAGGGGAADDEDDEAKPASDVNGRNKPRDEPPKMKMSAVARASGVLYEWAKAGRKLTITGIAREAGCDRTHLYRSQEFRDLLMTYRGARPPKGSKNAKTGELEAWDED
jgi:hypothetical protein